MQEGAVFKQPLPGKCKEHQRKLLTRATWQQQQWCGAARCRVQAPVSNAKCIEHEKENGDTNNTTAVQEAAPFEPAGVTGTPKKKALHTKILSTASCVGVIQ